MTTGTLPARRGTILVTGGTGFVGSAVLRALLRHDPPERRPEIRVLTRRYLPTWMTEAGVFELRGDLVDRPSLRGMCDGVSTLVHLASHIGDDADQCAAVNDDGTATLLEEARRSGVRRVVNVSTAAVYGAGIHRGVSESMLAPKPASVTSQTRLAAERAVRAIGGIVLRPHLVYGPGDRWFVPAMIRLLHHVPAWIDGGSALSSVIAVDDLARVVAALARLSWGPSRGAVFHLNHPQPVSMNTLIKSVCGQLGLPTPEHDLPAAVHRGATKRAVPELTDHQFSLLADDHWYDSGRIWRYVGVRSRPSPLSLMGQAAGWYRGKMAI